MKTLSARQDLAYADLTLIVFPSHLLVHPSLAGWWLEEGRVPSRVASVSLMLMLEWRRIAQTLVPSLCTCRLCPTPLIVSYS